MALWLSPGPDGIPSECVLALEAPLSCSFGAADKGASCCGMHSEGNPSGPFVLGLRGLQLRGEWRASRLMWGAARASCVLRSAPESKQTTAPAMSALRRITGWGNNGALRAFGKGFVLRIAFRGKPVGSLRPRSSGIGADENKVRFAPCDCSGCGPVWDRGCFVVGQI